MKKWIYLVLWAICIASLHFAIKPPTRYWVELLATVVIAMGYFSKDDDDDDDRSDYEYWSRF